MNNGISNGISNGYNSTWKRLKTQHIAVAAAGALAFSALIGGVAIQEQTSAPSAPSQQAARPAPSFDVAGSPAQVLVYVVGSEAEASALRDSFVGAAYETEDNVLRDVIVVNSPEGEAGLQIMQGELQTAGVTDTTTVLDLRR
jgi:hypothetical protein